MDEKGSIRRKTSLSRVENQQTHYSPLIPVVSRRLNSTMELINNNLLEKYHQKVFFYFHGKVSIQLNLKPQFFPEGTNYQNVLLTLVVQFQVWKKRDAENKRRKTLKVRKRTKLPASPLVSVQQRSMFTFPRKFWFHQMS